MAWTYSAYYIIFFQVRESYEGKEAKITLFFLSISLQEEKGPCFYLTLYWFSSSHRSSKPLLPPFFPQIRLFSGNLVFPAKVSFKGKKSLMITAHDRGWLVLFLWGKKQSICKIIGKFNQKVNLSWKEEKNIKG